MRILWVESNFLHPTTRGGQIRTLELLRRLHDRHEIHFVGLDDGTAEGPARASEYSARAYAIPHRVCSKTSPAFGFELAAGLFSSMPVAVARWRSPEMRKRITELLAAGRFDGLVCDFLFPVPNIPDLSRAVLFQHNVESVIWRRRAEYAPDPLRRAYLELQARRMTAFESDACRRAGRIVAVSAADADRIQSDFGATRISQVPTGIDVDFFAPPASGAAPVADLVFVGSMDWMPNVDGLEWFVRQVLPRIHARQPGITVALVGRMPPEAVRAWARRDSRLTVTGTVPDVRPYLWGSRVSIVPLRIGGGTRLKIYEAIASGLPVVATSTGCEGLPLTPGQHVAIADSPEAFAQACCALLEDEPSRRRMAGAARSFIAERFSWEVASQALEQILETAPRPNP